MHYRRVATRYDKTARNDMAFLHVALIMTLLLQDASEDPICHHRLGRYDMRRGGAAVRDSPFVASEPNPVSIPDWAQHRSRRFGRG